MVLNRVTKNEKFGSKGFTAVDVPDQSGKSMIVTGADAGIGFETAKVLAARGARVLLACRNKSKAEAAMKRIRQETPKADLVFIPYDQADLASIRHAAKRVFKEPHIDVLINNAGVQVPTLKHTAQGFELQFGVNHLGCFAFTSLLLPKLMQTPGSRIVITSSGQHKGAMINWEDINAEKSYRRKGIPRYGASKLANLLFVFELNRRLQAVGSKTTVVACHPGLAGTNLGQENNLAKVVMRLARVFLNTPAMGAWSELNAATGQIKPGGYYGPTEFFGLRGPSRESKVSKQAHDLKLAQQLWNLSIDMTGIDPGLPPVN
jgi:NAD(P)-dependent dehydrogenase (short-subunit alcohol dehydrogenase family)